MLHRCPVLPALLALLLPALAQEEADVPLPRPKKKDGVQITFLPPPMQGTISLGLYDAKGKLVRVLHQEATTKNFTVGLNGLITHWDGKDDTGQLLPAGKYSARGWMVGDVKAEGVAFHANDWVTDNSPRFARVLAVKNAGRDTIQAVLRDAAGVEHTKDWNLAIEGAEPPGTELEAVIEDGKLVAKTGGSTTPIVLAEGEKAVAASAGFGRNIWAIVETSDGREVRSYAPGGEFLRHLGYTKDEPAPRQLVASRWSETIYLLDENEREQRLRILTLAEKDGAPAWKTVEQKRIVFSDTFAAVTATLGRPQPPKPEEVVRLTSKPNSLLGNARTEVALQVVPDATGALLRTADGLPLTHLTDTKGLKWTVLVREEKALVLFQGDGAVVEEFKLGKPDNLMSFEAGDYELRR